MLKDRIADNGVCPDKCLFFKGELLQFRVFPLSGSDFRGQNGAFKKKLPKEISKNDMASWSMGINQGHGHMPCHRFSLSKYSAQIQF